MMERIDNISSLRVRQAVRSFVHNRANDFPISVADLAQRVRFAFADFKATDRELADLIAREIILAGGNVEFDTRAGLAVAALDDQPAPSAGPGSD